LLFGALLLSEPGGSAFPTGQKPSNSPVIRVTSRLVEVGVVVSNKSGPVTDLTKDDFRLFDRGKLQKIAVFQKNSTLRTEQASAPASPDVFSNRSVARPDSPPGVTIFLLDALNTHFPDQIQAKKEFLKLLGQIQPDDRMGVYMLGEELRVLQDFTSDSRLLVEAVRNAPTEITHDMAILNDPSALPIVKDMANIDRAKNTATALEAIANHLSHVPGRKNLIWISASFPFVLNPDYTPPPVSTRPTWYRLMGNFSMDVNRATRALNNANIAVYPVDARGLLVAPSHGANVSHRPSSEGFDTMGVFADATGGVAYHDTNDIRKAIATALEDSEVSYTLGFYPDSGQLDSAFHPLKVQVKRPGVEARYRKGYIAAPEGKPTDAGWAGQMAEALMSPLEASGIALSARLDRAHNRFAVSIAGGDIALDPEGDHWTGALDVMFAQQAADGHNLETSEKRVSITSKPPEYQALVKQGLSVTLPLSAPGAARVRVVVLDRNTGRLGSLTIPLAN
jgi:VWFA-related protein